MTPDCPPAAATTVSRPTELYRYDTHVVRRAYTTIVSVSPIAYPVLRYTPKGYWIEVDGYQKKFVLGGNGKRWAHERKDWALHSFRRRKSAYLWRLEDRKQIVEATLALLKKAEDDPDKLALINAASYDQHNYDEVW